MKFEENEFTKLVKMSKGHYELIAYILRHFGEVISKEELIEFMVDMFYDTNPRFNCNKFRRACYTQIRTIKGNKRIVE